MILCCGEALIDMLPRRTAGGEDAFVPCPGGAVFNTAVALGRLGVPAGLLSGISTDPFGQRLVEALKASGVDTTLCIRSARATTLAFVTQEGAEARYAFLDENSAGRMIRPADLPALPAAVEAMVFGGISLMAEPCGATWQALMERAAESGRVTMIDPNIRPAFIADEPAYRARIGRMIALADIVKLSEADLRWLEGPGGIAAGAAAVLARGPRLVLVTEGAAGAHGFTRGQSAFIPARRVAVVDTVGAGDTFNAGALAALHGAGALTRAGIAALDGDGLRAALALGNRAAAVTISRAGANPPRAEELS